MHAWLRERFWCEKGFFQSNFQLDSNWIPIGFQSPIGFQFPIGFQRISDLKLDSNGFPFSNWIRSLTSYNNVTASTERQIWNWKTFGFHFPIGFQRISTFQSESNWNPVDNWIGIPLESGNSSSETYSIGQTVPTAALMVLKLRMPYSTVHNQQTPSFEFS